MHNTGQAMGILINGKLGLTFISVENPNLHIFKTVGNMICMGIYGNDKICEFKYWEYVDNTWNVDFKASNIRK